MFNVDRYMSMSLRKLEDILDSGYEYLAVEEEDYDACMEEGEYTAESLDSMMDAIEDTRLRLKGLEGIIAIKELNEKGSM